MIYIFEDGRTLYKEELLRIEDEGNYIAVEELPEIPQIAGKIGYIVANLEESKLDFCYFDEFVPEEESRLDRLERVFMELEARIGTGEAGTK